MPEQSGLRRSLSPFAFFPPQEWLRILSCLDNNLSCGHHFPCGKYNTIFFSHCGLGPCLDPYLYLRLSRPCGLPLDWSEVD
jgi:hypothetical protein